MRCDSCPLCPIADDDVCPESEGEFGLEHADGIRNEGLTSMAVHVGDMEIAQAEFALLWDTTVKKSDLDRYGWAANPWVWVIEFERVEVQE